MDVSQLVAQIAYCSDPSPSVVSDYECVSVALLMDSSATDCLSAAVAVAKLDSASAYCCCLLNSAALACPPLMLVVVP